MEPLRHAHTGEDGRVNEPHDGADMDKNDNVEKLNIARLVIISLSFLSLVSWCTLLQLCIKTYNMFHII